MADLPHCTFIRWNFGLNREGSAEDIAVFGLWGSNIGDAEYGDEQLAAIAHGAYDAWANHASPDYWTTAVTLDSTLAVAYLANGHTLFEQNYVPDTVWQGDVSTASMPWETSLAVSLYTYPRGTFVTNGRRKRGRYYLPPVAAINLDPSNSGYFKNSTLPAFFADQVSFLNDFGKDHEGAPHVNLGVYSRKDDDCRDVTDLYIDAKFDSQRRRQNREVAGVLHTAYTP